MAILSRIYGEFLIKVENCIKSALYKSAEKEISRNKTYFSGYID